MNRLRNGIAAQFKLPEVVPAPPRLDTNTAILPAIPTERNWTTRRVVPSTPNPSVRIVEGKFREVQPDENRIHLPEIDKLRAATIPSRKYSPNCHEYVSAFDAVIENFFLISQELKSRGLLKGDYPPTSSLPDLRFVDKDNRVVFESFAHMLSVAFEYEQYSAKEIKLLAKELGDAEFFFRPRESPLEIHRRIVECTLPDERWVSDKIYRRNGKIAHLQLASLKSTKALFSSVETLVAVAREALMGTYGEIPDGEALQSFKRLLFCGNTARIFVSGKELLAGLENPLGLNIHRSNKSFRTAMLALIRGEVVPAENEPSTPALEGGEVQRLWHTRRQERSDPNPSVRIATGKYRKIYNHEVGIHLPEIDLLRQETLLGAADFKRDPKHAPGSDMELDSIYYQRDEVNLEIMDHFHGIVCSLKERKLVTEDYPATSVLPGIRFIDKNGCVVFESFGHMVSVATQYNRFMAEEWRKLVPSESGIEDRTEKTPDATLRQIVGSSIPIANIIDMTKSVDRSQYERVHGSADFQLLTLKGLDHNAGLLKSPSRSLMALREACFQVCGEIPDNLMRHLMGFTFSEPGGQRKLTGEELIHLTKEQNLLRLDDKWNSRLVAYLRDTENALGLKSSETPKLDRNERLRSIVSGRHVEPHLLFYALCALGEEKDTRRAYKDFETRIVKAPLKRESQQLASQESPLETAAALIEEAKGLRKGIDLSDLSKRRFTDLLKQLCYKSYEGDLDKMIAELESYRKVAARAYDSAASKVVEDIFEAVCPELIKVFKQVKKFKDPESVRIALIPQQREAVIGATAFVKPIVVFGPGSGKTEIQASIAECLSAKRVLWCTKRSNTGEAVTRLKDKILIDPAGVIELTNADSKKPSEEFKKMLEGTRYLVVGYDTLRKMKERSEENFKLLSDWIKQDVKICDEGHLLDHRTSKRSQAIQGLPSKHTIIGSATPFQHNPEDLATLLHIALPDRYPDVVGLTREFARSPELARSVMHSHSTIYGIEDIAVPFAAAGRIDFDQQLSGGLPRIPKALPPERVSYTLSSAHARLYVDIATNYSRWSGEGVGAKGLNQLHALRRLAYSPEVLGAEAPVELIEAVKKIALPALERGEKVLIAGYRTNPLELLSQDPDLAKFGSTLLSGKFSPEERLESLHKFEESKEINCALIQMQAAGSGHNCRGAATMIFIDRPAMISDLVQAMGRPVRLLFKGDERFAVENVSYHFLEPTLPKEVVAEVQEPERRAYLERGTIFEGWLTRDLAKLEDYKRYVARGGGRSALQNLSNVTQVAEELKRAAEQFYKGGAQVDLLSTDGNSPKGRYNNPVKNLWREEALAGFVQQYVGALGKDPEDIKVALMPGPEALEIPIYLDLGIDPKNIFAFESGSGRRRALCEAKVAEYGCNFVSQQVEQGLLNFNHELDIISIDPDGYLTTAMFEMFRNLRLSQRAIVLKNTMASREAYGAMDLVERSGGRREATDAALFKLLGTSNTHALGAQSGEQALRVASHVRSAARALGQHLAPLLETDANCCTDFLAEMYLGSPHLWGFEQLRYISPEGRPFLSTFGLAASWDKDFRDSEAAKAMRQIVGDMSVESLVSGRRFGEQGLRVARNKQLASVSGDRIKQTEFSLTEATDVFNYFDVAALADYRLKRIVNHEPRLIRLA